MRIDFNQSGSWRKGPDFDERDIELVKEAAARFADLVGAKLRIIGESGEVFAYRDAEFAWREQPARRRT